mgnify:CR=1 FL=1
MNKKKQKTSRKQEPANCGEYDIEVARQLRKERKAFKAHDKLYLVRVEAEYKVVEALFEVKHKENIVLFISAGSYEEAWDLAENKLQYAAYLFRIEYYSTKLLELSDNSGIDYLPLLRAQGKDCK